MSRTTPQQQPLSIWIVAGTVGFGWGLVTSAVTAVITYIWYHRTIVPRDRDEEEETEPPHPRDCALTNHHNSIESSSSSSSHGVSFLSDMTRALWPQLHAVAIATIQSTGQPVLDRLSRPSSLLWLRNLRFTHISLGHVPPQFDPVRISERHQINPVTQQPHLTIICPVRWNGACDIQLACALGTFGIRSISFRGTLLIDCQPLVETTSLISAIQYSFLHPPEIRISDFTGLANVADVSTIKQMIQASIVEAVTEMMVLPNRTVMRMSRSHPVSFLDIYQPPVGVVRITLLQGFGFDPSDTPTSTKRVMPQFFRDVPDLYCTIQIGADTTGTTIWTSSVMQNTTRPNWTTEDPSNCTLEALVYHLDQMVTLTCYDGHPNPMEGVDVVVSQSDTVVGRAQISVAELLYHRVHALPLHSTLDATTRRNSTVTGASLQVQCELYPLVSDLSTLPVPQVVTLEPTTTITTPVVVNPPDEPDAIRGLITVLIAQATDLPIFEETSGGDTSSYVMMTFGRFEPFVATATTNGVDPLYDHEFHIPITNQMMYEVQYNIQQLPPIVLSVMDGVPPSEGTTDPPLHKYGAIEISMSQLVQSHDGIISGKHHLTGGSHPQHHQNAKLEYLCALHSVAKSTTDSVTTTTTETPDPTMSSPFIHVTIVKGWGFQIEKRALKLDDVPDVYCTIQLGSNPTIWTTSTVKNTTTPVWNERHAFFVAPDLALSSVILYIHVYDRDTGPWDTDDELGRIQIPLTKVLLSPHQTCDCELQHEGEPTNAYISIQCSKGPSPPSQ